MLLLSSKHGIFLHNFLLFFCIHLNYWNWFFVNKSHIHFDIEKENLTFFWQKKNTVRFHLFDIYTLTSISEFCLQEINKWIITLASQTKQRRKKSNFCLKMCWWFCILFQCFFLLKILAWIFFLSSPRLQTYYFSFFLHQTKTTHVKTIRSYVCERQLNTNIKWIFFLFTYTLQEKFNSQTTAMTSNIRATFYRKLLTFQWKKREW